MKAVVLARGLARRMKEDQPDATLDRDQAAAAGAGQKAMMPVGAGRRPFLDYILSSLADAGASEVGLVIGPEHGAIRRRYEVDAPPRRSRVRFLVQERPLGTANAVLASETWTDGDPFLVLNGDNLYPVPALRDLVELTTPGLPAFARDALVRESNIPAERVAAFALLDVDAEGWLRAIVEKPGEQAMAAAGGRALVSMNCWRFDERIYRACRDVSRSARGEFELPEAVALAIARGVAFRAVPARGAVLDLSRRTDVADVARRLAGIEAHP